MSKDRVKRLEGRIVELENQLEDMQAGRQRAANFTDEEFQAYACDSCDSVCMYGPDNNGIGGFSSCVLECAVSYNSGISGFSTWTFGCNEPCMGPGNSGIGGFSLGGSGRFGGLGD